MSTLIAPVICHHPQCLNICPEGHVCCSEECVQEMHVLGMQKKKYYALLGDLRNRAYQLQRLLSQRSPSPSKVEKIKAEVENLKRLVANQRQLLTESGVEF